MHLAFNKGLQIAHEEDFVRFMLREVPPQPPQAAGIRAVNMGMAERVEV